MITDEEKHDEEDSEVENEERVRMAPNIGAGGSHLQGHDGPGRRRRKGRRKMKEGRMGRL